ncbi:MAG: A/G-specific adenine glycosylase [Spirochaetia bacterium]|jgi:A/G-specific adenine glycosylase|nr:A/G-specific adenine glycosylase [Spirochaetia bacterium]
MGISEADASQFKRAVLDFYAREGRTFPWRETRDPWAILVSEAMLQQTQTQRVEPKYRAWMKQYPDAAALAEARLSDVYESWKGLGYNSRALRLRDTARICSELYGGVPPADEGLLLGLPGIGRYTAGAVRAFAYNIPVVILETNIRAALIFHFFKGSERVSDRDLEPVAESVLDRSNSRRWYYALMDYGVWLKKHEPNPSRKAAVYARQTRFEGSLRQLRGEILRTLAALGSVSLATMAAEMGSDYQRILSAAKGLEKDGIVYLDDDTIGFTD